jgi:hypothetical protein
MVKCLKTDQQILQHSPETHSAASSPGKKHAPSPQHRRPTALAPLSRDFPVSDAHSVVAPGTTAITAQAAVGWELKRSLGLGAGLSRGLGLGLGSAVVGVLHSKAGARYVPSPTAALKAVIKPMKRGGTF